MARLNPHFEVDGEQLLMMTQFAGAVPARLLGRVVKPFHDEHYAISVALNILLTGF